MRQGWNTGVVKGNQMLAKEFWQPYVVAFYAKGRKEYCEPQTEKPHSIKLHCTASAVYLFKEKRVYLLK